MKTIELKWVNKVMDKRGYLSTDKPFIIYQTTHLTGHDHYRSAYETDDECGNCSGARCDYCKKYTEIEITLNNGIHSLINILIYAIKDYGFTYDESKAIFKEIENNGGWEYRDEEHDIFWKVESPEDIEHYYHNFFEYLTTEVWVVRTSSSYSDGTILGIFDTEEEAMETFSIVRTSLSTYLEDIHINDGKYFYGTNKKQRVNLSVMKEFLGNITLNLYEKEEGEDDSKVQNNDSAGVQEEVSEVKN